MLAMTEASRGSPASALCVEPITSSGGNHACPRRRLLGMVCLSGNFEWRVVSNPYENLSKSWSPYSTLSPLPGHVELFSFPDRPHLLHIYLDGACMGLCFGRTIGDIVVRPSHDRGHARFPPLVRST